METKVITAEIAKKGFIHLAYPNALSIEALQNLFGSCIFKTLIKENPKSTRLLAGNLGVDLHTDHIKAAYIAWRCESQAAIGGESLLVDCKAIFLKAKAPTLSVLQNISIKSHRLFYADKPEYPLYDTASNIIYYAPFLCELPMASKEQQALQWFQQEIELAEKTEIKLSEGDWLVIDNHRMLHGRKGFEPQSNRLLTRYWLSGKANNINN